jgi:predicted dehydrogenase
VRTAARLPEAVLAAVCDVSDQARESVARSHPDVHLTADVDDLLERVDGVVIATSARTHAALATRAVEAGKPVLVEKPFALSVVEAATVAALAADRGIPILVGHLLLFHPVVERLRELMQNGTLGRVLYMHGQRVNLGQVRPDENALWSFGPHDVSVALFLLGERPVRVAAQGSAYLQPGVEDVVFVHLDFPSGVLAHLQLSWLDPHKERRLTVVGERQMAVFNDMEPREKLRLYDKGVDRPPEYASFGESLAIREGDIAIPKLPNTEPLAAELRHFVEVVSGREAPRAGPSDGVDVVRILEAADRSLASGGVPEHLETM